MEEKKEKEKKNSRSLYSTPARSGMSVSRD
jgi:hypothetical protein